MELDEIKTIVELMSKHNLSEFKVEAENMHLCLKREMGAGFVNPAASQNFAMPAISPHMQPVVPVAAPQPEPQQPQVAKVTIDAPIVGTFYRSASPDSEAFIKVGDRVESESVVCIIEAMKVMNEIKADKSGIIKEILVENAQSVEYGCPLFVIE